MGRKQPEGGVEIPQDLTEALQGNPEAAAIWDELPAAHRRGHVIAIERIADDDERVQRVEHTVEHLLERHAS